MRLLWPGLLWGLLLVPLAVAAYIGLDRRRLRRATRFGSRAMWPNLLPLAPGWRRHVAPALVLLAAVVLLFGLTRPQRVLQVQREEATVVLAMDFSASMLATDVPPSRVAAARATAEGFIEQLPGQYRLGLVTFNGSATTRALPTTDREAVRTALRRVNPEGGTAIGEAINRALEAGGAQPPRQDALGAPQAPPTPDPDRVPLTIVLLSDGYSTEGRPPLAMAEIARGLDVPVFTIAIGTQTGRTPDGAPAPPDEATLRQVAEITGGRFFSAPTSQDLQAVYANLGSKIGFTEKLTELTVIPLAVAVLLFLAGGLVSLLWFSRFP